MTFPDASPQLHKDWQLSRAAPWRLHDPTVGSRRFVQFRSTRGAGHTCIFHLEPTTCLTKSSRWDPTVCVVMTTFTSLTKLLQRRRCSSSVRSMRLGDSSVPDIFIRASIASRGFYQTLSQQPLRSQAAPNQAQRTAPGVTLAAADRPAACAHPAPRRLRPQPARRPPRSLSLGSFGDATRSLQCTILR
jgi:hypothetical protein